MLYSVIFYILYSPQFPIYGHVIYEIASESLGLKVQQIDTLKNVQNFLLFQHAPNP